MKISSTIALLISFGAFQHVHGTDGKADSPADTVPSHLTRPDKIPLLPKRVVLVPGTSQTSQGSNSITYLKISQIINDVFPSEIPMKVTSGPHYPYWPRPDHLVNPDMNVLFHTSELPKTTDYRCLNQRGCFYGETLSESLAAFSLLASRARAGKRGLFITINEPIYFERLEVADYKADDIYYSLTSALSLPIPLLMQIREENILSIHASVFQDPILINAVKEVLKSRDTFEESDFDAVLEQAEVMLEQERVLPPNKRVCTRSMKEFVHVHNESAGNTSILNSPAKCLHDHPEHQPH